MNFYHQKFVLLSSREKQVLEQLLNGITVSQIAIKLNLKSNTISTIKKNLLIKFKVKSLIKLIYLLEINGVKVNETENSGSKNYIIENEDKIKDLIQVRNSNSFFELVKIGTKYFVFEINKEGVKSIYKKIK